MVGCRYCGRVFVDAQVAKEHVATCKSNPKAQQPAPTPAPAPAAPAPASAPADNGEKKPSDLSPAENTQVVALVEEIKKLCKTWRGDWSITEPVFMNHGTRESEFAYKVNDVAVLTSIRDEFAAMVKRHDESIAKAEKKVSSKRK
jgi:hypothetical protein